MLLVLLNTVEGLKGVCFMFDAVKAILLFALIFMGVILANCSSDKLRSEGSPVLDSTPLNTGDGNQPGQGTEPNGQNQNQGSPNNSQAPGSPNGKPSKNGECQSSSDDDSNSDSVDGPSHSNDDSKSDSQSCS